MCLSTSVCTLHTPALVDDHSTPHHCTLTPLPCHSLSQTSIYQSLPSLHRIPTSCHRAVDMDSCTIHLHPCSTSHRSYCMVHPSSLLPTDLLPSSYTVTLHILTSCHQT